MQANANLVSIRQESAEDHVKRTPKPSNHGRKVLIVAFRASPEANRETGEFREGVSATECTQQFCNIGMVGPCHIDCRELLRESRACGTGTISAKVDVSLR